MAKEKKSSKKRRGEGKKLLNRLHRTANMARKAMRVYKHLKALARAAGKVKSPPKGWHKKLLGPVLKMNRARGEAEKCAKAHGDEVFTRLQVMFKKQYGVDW